MRTKLDKARDADFEKVCDLIAGKGMDRIDRSIIEDLDYLKSSVTEIRNMLAIVSKIDPQWLELFQIESMFAGRWNYWARTIEHGQPLDDPIPKIDFLDFPDPSAMNNLTQCLSAYNRHDFRLADFLEWLLWGFGDGERRAQISDEANEFLYRTFNLGLLLQHPHDYFGHILSEHKKGY